MSLPKLKGDLTAYRIDHLEEAVKTIGTALTGIDKSLEALTSLEARHAQVQESVGRAFERLEKSEAEILRLDSEFKKWFNRGAGVASVATLLFLLVGSYIGNELRGVSDAVAKVSANSQQLQTQRRINAVVMRKLGIDPELLAIQ